MKSKSLIIVAIVVTLFGAIAWTLASNKKEIDSRKEVNITEERIAVTVASAQLREICNQLELVGLAEPDKEVVVASESAGKIVQISFKLGDFVNKGAVLANVDDTYKRLAFENAQLNYNKYKEDYERYQVLRKGDAVSEEQLRNMKIGFENASIQLENTKKQLDDTKIVAPFSGVITSKNTELGAYVNAGTPIAGMADIAQLKIMLAVSESNVYQLHKGQEVSVSTNVYPGVTYIGTISSISPQGSSAHTFPVEIVIANSSKNPLKAGTYVNARVDMGKSGKTLMIPRDAILSSIKDPSVYVVKGEKVELVKINTGLEYNSYLEVTSGINEGDQVVTNGQINLTEGAKISIIK
ncbi:MAG: efflux RND transporter periplasmic adaptor subunit [Bacteroidales bacterium]|jgi:RND family efflux transporter MFP subunit